MPLIDPPLTSPPKIKFYRLRDIGWSKWDPIGLLADGQKWDDEECQPFADEYDSYFLQAAGQLRRGATEEEVVRYLVGIEANYMGLGPARGAAARAKEVFGLPTRPAALSMLWQMAIELFLAAILGIGETVDRLVVDPDRMTLEPHPALRRSSTATFSSGWTIIFRCTARRCSYISWRPRRGIRSA